MLQKCRGTIVNFYKKAKQTASNITEIFLPRFTMFCGKIVSFVREIEYLQKSCGMNI